MRSIGPIYLAPSPSVAYVWSSIKSRNGPPCLIGLPHRVSSHRSQRSARIRRRPAYSKVRPSLSYSGWYRFISPTIISHPIGNLVARCSRGLAQPASPLQGKYIKYIISICPSYYRQIAAQSSPVLLVHSLVAILLLIYSTALPLPYTRWYLEDCRQYDCFVCLLIQGS